MKRITLTLSLLGVGAAIVATAAVAARDVSRRVSPLSRVAAIERIWRANLRSGATAEPNLRFPNPSAATLDARLRVAAARYHFRVVKVVILHPRQAAPFVVIQAKGRRALAAATSDILRLIDPRAPTNDDRTGWAYEGFFFQARDEDGVPFLATFNWWRGPHAGGGQWASDPTLYPYAHG